MALDSSKKQESIFIHLHFPLKNELKRKILKCVVILD